MRVDEGSIQLVEGGELIAEGRAADMPELKVPAPVGPEQAREATARYRGLPEGLFSRCFVCGRARDDAFGGLCWRGRGT